MTGTPLIEVLIVDDHALMRAGLRGLIAGADDMQVVGMAADGAEALQSLAASPAHVVLMDLSMPGMDGVTATGRIREQHPDVAVLVLTSFSDQPRVMAALDAGAVGYVPKDTEPAVLLDAVRAVARGHSPLDPRVARAVLHGRRTTPGATELSEREQEVLALVGRGLPNKQIARTLRIREGTVKAHLTNVLQRIGVRDRTSAALWARENLTHASKLMFPLASPTFFSTSPRTIPSLVGWCWNGPNHRACQGPRPLDRIGLTGVV
jgi:DNA-binding NarL/FixJ family response regulator